VGFSGDDQTIISGSDDATIRYWDLASGTQRSLYLGHNGRVWHLAVSPDGRALASAGSDGTVRLWQAEAGAPLRLPNSRLVRFAFSSDGQSLATFELPPVDCSADPWHVMRWDTYSGRLLGKVPLGVSGTFEGAEFNRDGQLLALRTNEHGLTLCNTATCRLESLLDPSAGRVGPVDFSPDGRYLVQHSADGPFSIRDLASGLVIPFPWRELDHVSWTWSGEVIAVRHDGECFRWDPRTGRSQALLFQQPHSVWWPVMSPDCRTLAAADPETHKVHLWSVESLELKSDLPVSVDVPGTLAFTPDGKTLASTAGDQTVKLWDVATGQELLTLGGPSCKVWTLLFSPDGRTLASSGAQSDGSAPREVLLWRTAEREAGPGAPGQGASGKPSR
jgi:uncharacterized protein with WD repeat